jgi:hypothetical protein
MLRGEICLVQSKSEGEGGGGDYLQLGQSFLNNRRHEMMTKISLF